MASKTVPGATIIIRVPYPLTYPLEAELRCDFTVDGLPELGAEEVYLVDSVPNGAVTVDQMINTARQAIRDHLIAQGDGGHTVND